MLLGMYPYEMVVDAYKILATWMLSILKKRKNQQEKIGKINYSPST